MIFSPAIASFFDAALNADSAGRPTADRLAATTLFGRRRHDLEKSCLDLYQADDATMKDLGLTRQHVLRLMSQQFGR